MNKWTMVEGGYRVTKTGRSGRIGQETDLVNDHREDIALPFYFK